MAEFSGGRFAVLGDLTANQSSEEEEDLEEITISSGKAGKKKTEGDEYSGVCETSDRTEATSNQNLETAAEYHSDHHKASFIGLHTKEGQQEADFDSFPSEVLSVKSRPSNMGQANQCSGATTSPDKKKKRKKKNKSANIGFFPSQFNSTSSKPIDKRKEIQDEKGKESGAGTGILQSESDASLPKPTDEAERMETNNDKEGEEGASTGILSFESKVLLPKPADEERIETHNNDEEGEGFEAKETAVEASSQEELLTDLERLSNKPTLLTKEEKER